MSTYLQLVSSLHRECSISGNAPTSVVNQIGIYNRLAQWVADAVYELEALHGDWNFMWAQWSQPTVAGIATYSAPVNLGEWDRESFFLNHSASNHKRLVEMDYRKWRESYRNGVLTPAKPDLFVVRPDKGITLSPVPDDAYTLTADYWKIPTRLAANNDTSEIPVQYERAIITLAKMKYAEDQGAPTMLTNAQQEHLLWLEKLEAGELPGQERRRKSTPEQLIVRVE